MLNYIITVMDFLYDKNEVILIRQTIIDLHFTLTFLFFLSISKHIYVICNKSIVVYLSSIEMLKTLLTFTLW